MGLVLRSRLLWIVMGGLLLSALGSMTMRQLARDPRFLTLPQAVSIDAPAWGGEQLAEPVRRQLQELGPINLFDARFVERVEAAVAGFPGVARVDAVHRHWPDRYSVSFTYHRPVALASGVPVTWGRIALPLAPYEHAVRGLLTIHGVGRRAPEPGTQWQSNRLRAGLVALAQIGPHLGELNRLGIRAIDVSRAHLPLEGVLLRGHDGTVVRWGRPLARVGENTVSQKIGYLREASRYVEQVRGMEIDVRFDDLYVRKPTTQ